MLEKTLENSAQALLLFFFPPTKMLILVVDMFEVCMHPAPIIISTFTDNCQFDLAVHLKCSESRYRAAVLGQSLVLVFSWSRC